MRLPQVGAIWVGSAKTSMGNERFGEQAMRGARRNESDAGTMNAHRAALEALFAPRTPEAQPPRSRHAPPMPSKRDSATMVTAAPRVATDARDAHHERLVARLVSAEGRSAVSRAAEDVVRAGLAFPADQEVQLQLLEHGDEARVRDAIEVLSRLVDAEPAKRRTVLDSRLRRIEDGADETSTRDLASELRRKLTRSARAL